MSEKKGLIHEYLVGSGRDSGGRSIETVLAFDDASIEAVHDFIQWLFPLPVASRAQPHSPVLAKAELEAIRRDPVAVGNLKRASKRMATFYIANDHWLTPFDHNHLRITRIITSLRLIAGPAAAQEFYAAIADRVRTSPMAVNSRSLRFWSEALSGQGEQE
jgi:hypothetical protein